jgi:hypothetical protein
MQLREIIEFPVRHTHVCTYLWATQYNTQSHAQFRCALERKSAEVSLQQFECFSPNRLRFALFLAEQVNAQRELRHYWVRVEHVERAEMAAEYLCGEASLQEHC